MEYVQVFKMSLCCILDCCFDSLGSGAESEALWVFWIRNFQSTDGVCTSFKYVMCFIF